MKSKRYIITVGGMRAKHTRPHPHTRISEMKRKWWGEGWMWVIKHATWLQSGTWGRQLLHTHRRRSTAKSFCHLFDQKMLPLDLLLLHHLHLHPLLFYHHHLLHHGRLLVAGVDWRWTWPLAGAHARGNAPSWVRRGYCTGWPGHSHHALLLQHQRRRKQQVSKTAEQVIIWLTLKLWEIKYLCLRIKEGELV